MDVEYKFTGAELADYVEKCRAAWRATMAPDRTLNDPCPIPDVYGWTMRDCFAAKRCGCAYGVALGYRPTTMPVTQT